ncbi:hypothetical protein RM530_00335 [Algiphilus sp. W345]|uniref:Uncharacterized protein n=1 Tax=Banduia mediterranea TaxID=3075609 RepID=A0ABU2WD66_9GAMM|nr:hypothetical protein [Algiphilus sp. W345]MDT0495816.1 hypothetical protein [Algiphilus sp. W345]
MRGLGILLAIAAGHAPMNHAWSNSAAMPMKAAAGHHRCCCFGATGCSHPGIAPGETLTYRFPVW